MGKRLEKKIVLDEDTETFQISIIKGEKVGNWSEKYSTEFLDDDCLKDEPYELMDDLKLIDFNRRCLTTDGYYKILNNEREKFQEIGETLEMLSHEIRNRTHYAPTEKTLTEINTLSNDVNNMLCELEKKKIVYGVIATEQLEM